MTPPRIAPLPPEDWDDGVRDALSPLLPTARANPQHAGNVLATLVRHQPLVKAYLTFNAYLLLDSTLPVRTREVAVLRTALVNGSDYLWSHHLPIAERAGITFEVVDDIRTGRPSDPVDRTVVAAVDDLHEGHAVTDDTWSELGVHFDDAQRLDLLFTIGGYQMLALVVNTLAVAPEHD